MSQLAQWLVALTLILIAKLTPGESDVSLIRSLRAILLLTCEWSVITHKLRQI
jgi:hypothetical protein